MEVIQLSDDDDDFIQSVNPSAPRRSCSKQAEASFSKDANVFKRPPPISTRIDSDPILKPSTSATSIDDDECPICGRDLRLLNEQRRTLHLNSCLDDGEAKADLEKSMDKWKSTMDCPVCKTPLAAGPFRSAHIKKCGREHAINGKDLLNLVNTQEKVADSRRKRALPHTSAKTPKLRPKKVSKLDGEPKSVAEEELLMAKALSASMMDPSEMEKEEELKKKKKEEEKRGKIGEGVSPQFTRIINDNIRRRRSYAVVELAPRGCRCDVIELIQSRFLRVFRARRKVIGEKKREEKKKKKEKEETDRVKERLNEGEKRTLRTVHIEATMANTLSRLDALSWAYRNLAIEGEQKGDVTIECTDGQIRSFSWALLARTTALGRVVEENMKLSIDQPTTVVRHWLQYVCCGRVEWAVGGENDGVREIAKQHGPEGLVEECARMAKTRREYLGFGRIGGVTEEEDTVATIPKETTVLPTVPSEGTVPPEATVPPVETREEIAAEEPEVLAPPPQEDLLPSDDARLEEREEEEGHKEGQTMDSEGSISDALKKCAAARFSSPRPLDSSFLAALQAPPPIEVTPITVPPLPPARETPKDSFFDSIVYGETPTRKEEEQAPPPTVTPPPSTVVQPTDPTESAESMDEEDAVRNILDVSCLRRSPRIRLKGDEEEGRKDTVISPELFDDCEEDGEGGGEGSKKEMGQRVPSPRSSPRRFSSQSIPADAVTPTTSRPSLRKSILGQKKLQEVIYLDDTPVSSPATVAIKPVTVSIEKKEEITVDESFPRVDQPSYGQGGMDTVDTVDGGEEQENRDASMDEGEAREGGGEEEEENVYQRSFEYNDDYGAHDWNDYEGGGEEADPSVSARAREEVDSFLQSLNESRHKASFSSPSKAGRPSTEIDSFLLSMRMGMESSKEGEEEEGTGDILGALSPVRTETEPVFKTPIVRGGRGRGRGGRGGRGAAFGSNVKVLKWSNVTPKPQFEAMDDAALKTQLARYGLRPMGRKRAIAMLTEIYEQTHPVVDDSAAAGASSSRSSDGGGGEEISPTKRKSTVEEEDEEDEGEKTLNRSESSDEEGSERGGGVGAAEESMIIPKASLKSADNQLVLFLEWLRQPPQKDLYDHCLALKSISLEELEVKLKRTDSALCGISRKVLMCVLDRLHITYSLPQEGWKRKRK